MDKDGNSKEALSNRAAKQPRNGGKFVKRDIGLTGDSCMDRQQEYPANGRPLSPANDGPDAGFDLSALKSIVTHNKTENASVLQTTLKPKGTFTVSVFGRKVILTGGPYLAKPKGYIGIKMAKEIDAHAAYDIPTPDFQTPNPDLVFRTALSALRDALIYGDRLYVGCMAGQGRTGLFLASVAALLGSDTPVKDVRRDYYGHAVETKQQEEFVDSMRARSEQFRAMLMYKLIRSGDVTFKRLRQMSWADRRLWLKVRVLGI